MGGGHGDQVSHSDHLPIPLLDWYANLVISVTHDKGSDRVNPKLGPALLAGRGGGRYPVELFGVKEEARSLPFSSSKEMRSNRSRTTIRLISLSLEVARMLVPRYNGAWGRRSKRRYAPPR